MCAALCALVALLLALASAGDIYNPPFSSWWNLKTDLGCVGDGVADDTACFQSGLAKLEQSTNLDRRTLYIPAGTYKITSTVTMTDAREFVIIGADPTTTTIQWAGAAGGTLLLTRALTTGRFARLRWRGTLASGRVGKLISHEYTGGGLGCSDFSHVDEIFENADIGINAGVSGQQVSEVAVTRCRFLQNGIGISINTGNVLNWWLRDSYWQGCDYGVKASFGDFFARGCIFSGSTIADFFYDQSCQYAIRGCTSVGSNMFLNVTGSARYWSHLVMAKNRVQRDNGRPIVIDWVSAPLVLMDNALKTTTNGACTFGWSITTLIVGDNHQSAGSEQGWRINGPVPEKCFVDANFNATVASLSTPSPVAFPAVVTRQVFEVTGFDAAAIQQAINSAQAVSGSQPVVHLPSGGYTIGATITIPANFDVQVVGDGARSRLNRATGFTGPLIVIQGPSKATLRDFYIFGGQGASPGISIMMNDVDQPGSKIQVESGTAYSCTGNCYHFQGMRNGDVILRDSQGGGSMSASSSIYVAGAPSTTARVWALGGTYGASQPVFQVANGGWLRAEDMWGESPFSTYFKGTGTGTFSGASMRWATYNTAQADPTKPTVDIANFAGNAAFINIYISTPVTAPVTLSNGPAGRNILFAGTSGDGSWISNTDTSGNSKVIACNSDNGGQGFIGNSPASWDSSNISPADKSWFLNMMAPARLNEPVFAYDSTAGVSSVQLYNVRSVYGTTFIYVNSTPPTTAPPGTVSPPPPPPTTAAPPPPPTTAAPPPPATTVAPPSPATTAPPPPSTTVAPSPPPSTVAPPPPPATTAAPPTSTSAAPPSPTATLPPQPTTTTTTSTTATTAGATGTPTASGTVGPTVTTTTTTGAAVTSSSPTTGQAAGTTSPGVSTASGTTASPTLSGSPSVSAGQPTTSSGATTAAPSPPAPAPTPAPVCDVDLMTNGCVDITSVTSAIAQQLSVSSMDVAIMSYECPTQSPTPHLVVRVQGGDCSLAQQVLDSIAAINQTSGGKIATAALATPTRTPKDKGSGFRGWIIAVVVVVLLVAVAGGVAVWWFFIRNGDKPARARASSRQIWDNSRALDEMYKPKP